MCGLNSIHLEGQNISLTGTKEACEQGLKFLDAQLQSICHGPIGMEKLFTDHEVIAKQCLSFRHNRADCLCSFLSGEFLVFLLGHARPKVLHDSEGMVGAFSCDCASRDATMGIVSYR